MTDTEILDWMERHSGEWSDHNGRLIYTSCPATEVADTLDMQDYMKIVHQISLRAAVEQAMKEDG